MLLVEDPSLAWNLFGASIFIVCVVGGALLLIGNVLASRSEARR